MKVDLNNFYKNDWMLKKEEIMNLWVKFNVAKDTSFSFADQIDLFLKRNDSVNFSNASSFKSEGEECYSPEIFIRDQIEQDNMDDLKKKKRHSKKEKQTLKAYKKKEKKKIRAHKEKEIEKLRKISMVQLNDLAIYDEIVKYLDWYCQSEDEMVYFYDPFGHIYKLNQKTEQKEVETSFFSDACCQDEIRTKVRYFRGMQIFHYEFGKFLDCYLWNPYIHPSRIFKSNIVSYTLVSSDNPFRNLNDIVQFSLGTNYDFCIITQFNSKRFIGQVVDGEISKGIISSEKDDIKFYAGKQDSYYGEIFSRNKNTKYLGGILEEKRENYGIYYESNVKKYEGFFSDDLPHGKGILYDDTGKVLFKG